MSTEPDLSLCPLCGATNRCAVTSGAAIETCWCADTIIGRDIVESIPEALRNRACLCPQCAAGRDGTVSTWSQS